MNDLILLFEITLRHPLIASALLIWLTCVFFAAVMRYRQMRDAGQLEFKDNPLQFIQAYSATFAGLFLDTIVNLGPMTVLLVELPQLKGGRNILDKEWLTTARLCRWKNAPDDNLFTKYWRKAVIVRIGEWLLNAVDTDGIHIK